MTADLPGEGWARRDVRAAGRVLATATPYRQPPGDVLAVVIEGDGRAHDRMGRPTGDPTPRNPQGLRIAKAWPHGPVVWIARPCQFTRRVDPGCRAEEWTTDRFGPQALAALDAAVDEAKTRAGASRIVLAGWSGGGVMAAALAGRRQDVVGLATFAAPMNVAAWTQRHGLTPLNLAPEVAGLTDDPVAVRQIHLYGARDPLVRADLEGAISGKVELVDEAHACCWDRRAKEAAEHLARLRAQAP